MNALRRWLWSWRLRLGTPGLLALAVAVLAALGSAWLAKQHSTDAAQAQRLQGELAQTRLRLAAQRQVQAQQAARQQDALRQAALAQAQAARPPASVPGMKLDARTGDEFIDPEQPTQGPPGPAAATVLPPGTSPARALLARLPPLAQREDDLALVLALAREAGLVNARTQYRRLDARSPGIARLELTLAANEGYEAWRTLMVGVLNRLPHAVVSGAAWTRSQAEAGPTEARLSFVLYHRVEAAP